MWLNIEIRLLSQVELCFDSNGLIAFLSIFLDLKKRWIKYQFNSEYWTFIILIFSIGSPADKADLEVADEILEINGKALHNCSHTEVIAHIHNVSGHFLKYICAKADYN